MNGYLIIAFVIFTAVMITAAVTTMIVRERDRKKIAYMLDAFEDEDYNFSFVEKSKFNKTLNRIKWIVEKRRQQNEQESWTKLIRVLTHEIMNTVSPIASLSEALAAQADKPTQEMDVKAGLQTISSSSKDLIKFVESYRELAGIARSVKKAVMVKGLVLSVIDLTAKQCSEAGASCTFKEVTPDTIIYADQSQISRILINLIKNALQAGATEIIISADMNEDEHTLISVSNNGTAISPESQDQIFIPFFTTKRDGSGIGLSLSRQIMRAHNGTIELTGSNVTKTEFLLTFK